MEMLLYAALVSRPISDASASDGRRRAAWENTEVGRSLANTGPDATCRMALVMQRAGRERKFTS